MRRSVLAAVVCALVLTTPSVALGATTHAPVKMPDLIGFTRAQVYAVMHRDGLYFETRGPGATTGTWVDVTAQSPRPGAEIKWHGQAELSVTTVSPRGPRAVPRVAGMTRVEVYAAMRKAQLYFTTVGPGSSNGSWKVALAISPAPGTKVRWHDEVTVRVATHRPATKKTAVAVRPVSAVVNGTNFKIGVATWYDWHPGQCATWYLPKGTRITVTDLSTGRSISCVITDRDESGSNRIVDLSETGFAELAPLSVGVISVKVSW